MPQYFVSIYFPEDFDPSTQTEADVEEIHALNREMEAAGATKFACGLHPPSSTKSLRYQPDGTVSVTDGPYTETKEYMGGFSVVEAADLDQAVEWALKGALICRASGEVRPIFFVPDPKEKAE
jgi:hypothetical protein